MEWNLDLCAEVAAIIATTEWRACSPDGFDISARPKTIDTLVEKLQRENLKLNQVQDLAGVRIDLDCSLATQTRLAYEIAEHFIGESSVKDLRATPHSGYRAVHVWLRPPAGRVEVQIRTRTQSVWANTYERVGDLAGRGIRYGERHEIDEVNRIVDRLHAISERIAENEEQHQQLIDIQRELGRALSRIEIDGDDPDIFALQVDVDRTARETQRRTADIAAHLQELERILDES